ncbi:hypothetical protein JOE11_004934 [Robbsia andropogonis]
MSQFCVIISRFAIVGTTGIDNGSQPAGKSEAVAFDVIDRSSMRTRHRDLPFWTAWEFCVSQLQAEKLSRLH